MMLTFRCRKLEFRHFVVRRFGLRQKNRNVVYVSSTFLAYKTLFSCLARWSRGAGRWAGQGGRSGARVWCRARLGPGARTRTPPPRPQWPPPGHWVKVGGGWQEPSVSVGERKSRKEKREKHVVSSVGRRKRGQVNLHFSALVSGSVSHSGKIMGKRMR
jgi:hypothetical protein